MNQSPNTTSIEPASNTSDAEAKLPVTNDLSVRLDFLRRCGSYPEPTTRVDVTETHMSWVFLTDRHAYKLKKPVRTGYLDFSTPTRRRHYCEEELRLNRRLAPETYLEVVPLTISPPDGMRIGYSQALPCEPIDWLVKMRRLPKQRMLDRVIVDGKLRLRELRAVAETLARFYLGASPVTLPADTFTARLALEIEDCRRELLRYGSRLPPPAVERLGRTQSEFLTRHAAEFERRVEAGRIVEGHGDLRPEHVFLGPPPQIIDCLEFNLELRTVDVIDDLATLAMECDRLDAPAVGQTLFATYTRMTKDDPPDSLIAFYKCVRASTRAKLAIWHLKDPKIANPEKWQDRARSYIDLAERESAKLN